MKYFLLTLISLLLGACNLNYIKPTNISQFKNIPTTYTITYDELENGYILDYETPMRYATGFNTSTDIVIFNPMVTYYNNTFNFHFNIIHEFQSRNSEYDKVSFVLYYKVNDQFNKIPLQFNNLFSSQNQAGNILEGYVSAFKVFYSMDNIESEKISRELSKNNIEEVRIVGDDLEFILNEESIFKLNESLKFYRDVKNLQYPINTESILIKDNGHIYHKKAEKNIDMLNIWL